MDNVRKETHVVFRHDRLRQGDLYCGQRRKGRSIVFSPHQIRRPRLAKEEKIPQTHQAAERKALQTKGAKFRAVTKNCKTTSLRPDANVEEHVSSDMLRLRRRPAQSQRKVVRKNQFASSKESTQIRENLFILREDGKLGTKTRRQILQEHLATKYKFGKERVHREELSKSVRLMS